MKVTHDRGLTLTVRVRDLEMYFARLETRLQVLEAWKQNRLKEEAESREAALAFSAMVAKREMQD